MTNITKKPDYIGIDVSSRKLDIYIAETQDYFILENAEKALRKWAKTLKPSSMVVLESTGGYEKNARRVLAEYNIPCHCAHPTRTHNFAKYKGYKAKTDRIDAQILAQYGAEENVKASPVLDPQHEEFRALVTRRAQLSEMIVSEKNRNNKTLHSSCVKYVESSIQFFETQKKDVEKRIREFIKASPELKKRSQWMRSLKGVGPVTVMNLLASLPQLGQATRSQIAALVGVAPYNQDSGKKIGRRRILGGKFELRKVLYMAAVTAIRYNKVMKVFYERLIVNKPYKVVIVAVMRKMLITLNQMMKEQQKWKFADN
jgi:transposase